LIRLLVTGFGPFPGAPLNPTEALVCRLDADPPALGDDVALAIEVVPTEYGKLAPTLDRFGREVTPDIAIHFGLAGMAVVLRLEGRARNAIAAGRPDAVGFCPTDATIVSGGADHASTLPLERIAAALTAAGIESVPSDDCGDYLCNAIFYHAVSGIVPSYRPAMAGFVHVPPSDILSPDDLDRAARIILSATVAAYRAQHGTAAARDVA
jgi:pyroglutamyl-peptidase